MKDFLNKEMLKKKEGKALDSSRQKGIGVIGLHEGRTLLVSLNRALFARALAGLFDRTEL